MKPNTVVKKDYLIDRVRTSLKLSKVLYDNPNLRVLLILSVTEFS
ncbi:hypothetical protein [Leptospira mayottensis]|nr:hypothetical protein [Leptospira mayottensis]